METEIQQGLEAHFENLVTGNIITQDQANIIKAIIHKTEVVKKEDFVNLETINDHRHKVYMDSNRVNYINSLKAFVDKGSITQDQADEIIMSKYMYAGQKIK